MKMRRLIGKESGDMKLDSSEMSFVGCRFRLRSVFDSYAIACEAFSEHFLLIPSGDI